MARSTPATAGSSTSSSPADHRGRRWPGEPGRLLLMIIDRIRQCCGEDFLISALAAPSTWRRLPEGRGLPSWTGVDRSASPPATSFRQNRVPDGARHVQGQAIPTWPRRSKHKASCEGERGRPPGSQEDRGYLAAGKVDMIANLPRQRRPQFVNSSEESGGDRAAPASPTSTRPAS